MKPKFEKDQQLTIGGSSLTEEEWTQALNQVQNVDTRCPFCLTLQNLRSMCFALPDGTLAKKRKCRNCRKEMLEKSATVFLQGEDAYGTWVATYPDFWHHVEHDKYMEALQSIGDGQGFKAWKFWQAYRKIRPKAVIDPTTGEPMRNAQGQIVHEGDPDAPKATYADYLEDEKKREQDLQPSVPDSDRERDHARAQQDADREPVELRSYTFKHKEDGNLWALKGESIEEDGDYWYIVYKTAKQRVPKSMWNKA